jgi:hypothetical protein
MFVQKDEEEKTEQQPVTHLPHFLMLKMIETLMCFFFELLFSNIFQSACDHLQA